jgi:hypothetical protein
MLAHCPVPITPMPLSPLSRPRGVSTALRLAALALTGPLLAGCAIGNTAAPAAATPGCAPPAIAMARVQLIFGSTWNDGRPIDDDAWQAFLRDEVTPRFPDGLTQLEGYGQWKKPDGTIVRLPSRTLLIWYLPAPDANARIDAVREAFKRDYRQISVMRVDGSDCVSF